MIPTKYKLLVLETIFGKKRFEKTSINEIHKV